MDTDVRISLLLVEDNDRTAQLAMEYLSSGLTEAENPVPVDVMRCRTMESARTALRRDFFDACVLDLNLPDSRGLESVHALREVEPDLPVLVLSASQEPELTSQLVKAGADGFVSKWLDNPLRLAREVLLVLVKRSDGKMGALEDQIHKRLKEMD